VVDPPVAVNGEPFVVLAGDPAFEFEQTRSVGASVDKA
jgi:hypothetical protein